MIVSWSPCECPPALATRTRDPGAPGGVLPGAGLPGGLVLTTARADGQRLGRGSRACCPAMPRRELAPVHIPDGK